MSNEFPPLIYVKLIKMVPLSFEQHFNRFRGSVDPRAKYDAYLENFQPFRVIVKSGDNQEPLFKGTERWKHRRDALHAIDLAFGIGSNVYLQEHEKGNVLLRRAS